MEDQEKQSGIMVVDKPLGISSMRAVAIVRRKMGGIKTGHAGTLDPLASGVLVMAVGKATKIISQLMDTTKRYTTTIDLTAFTTTDDLEGERQEVDVKFPPDNNTVELTLKKFTGEIMQKPPAFSAMKVNGRRAYKLARQGKEVKLEPRPVVIYSINIVEYNWPSLTIDVLCGKGTYIRSLARDIGISLNTGGHCTMLRRTAVGPFVESMAIAPDDIPDSPTMIDLIPVKRALEMVNEELN